MADSPDTLGSSNPTTKMALVLGKLSKCSHEIRFFQLKKTRFDISRCCASKNEEFKPESNAKEFKFRTLVLYPKKDEKSGAVERRTSVRRSPRTAKMTPDMDWTNVWPGPKTFHPGSVPLPLFQGVNKLGPPPGKNANAELMKIPNFLHLTPPAIEKHCNALKQFCTKWPENLQSDEDIEKHFPVEIITSDYCHSSCSIREPKARVISLRIKLKNLELDKHARDKFLRIVGKRYNPETDYVTITTDSCSIKKQNYDYAHYLLTAIYFESWKFEEWEKLKSDDDMEEYIFLKRKSFENVKTVFEYNKKELPELEEYGKAIEDFQNKGDDVDVIKNYKIASMKLLSVPPLET